MLPSEILGFTTLSSIRAVRVRTDPGPDMALIWRGSGVDLVLIWCGSGTYLGLIWCGSGTYLGLIWHKHIWIRVRTGSGVTANGEESNVSHKPCMSRTERVQEGDGKRERERARKREGKREREQVRDLRVA